MTGTKPVPEAMHCITPHRVCAGAADAIEFRKKAFKALDVLRIPGLQGSPALIPIYAGDVDAFIARAAAAKAHWWSRA